MIYYILIAFAASVISSLAILPWVLQLCHKNGIYDTPNARKVHQSRIPRMGGVVFIPTTAIGLVLSLIVMTSNANIASTMKVSTIILGAGLLLIYLLGFFDDLFGISAKIKLIVQFVAAIAFPLCSLYFDSLHGLFGIWSLPTYLGYALTVLLVMFIVNAMNTIDGIDGLCASFSIIALLAFDYALYDISNYIFCLFISAVIGSLLVFLFFNMFGNPEKGTKTFMGDSGSLVLGFILSYLTLKISCNNPYKPVPDYGFLLAISVLFIPTFDLVRVALQRILKGYSPFMADKTHIHHKLMAGGIYMRRALILLIIADLFIITYNLTLFHFGTQITWIFLSDIAFYTLLILWISKNEALWKNRMAIEGNMHITFEQNTANAQKICILTPRFPLPENGGDLLRINNIARELRKQGYKLILVSFEDNDAPQLFEAKKLYHKVYTVHRNKLRSHLMSLVYMMQGQPMQCGYYSSGAYRKMLRHVIDIEKPDLYIAHLLRMMPYLDELNLHDKSIIEMTDALSKTYTLSGNSKGSSLLRNVYRLEQKLILRAEKYSMLHFPKNVLVSQKDIDYLSTQSPHTASLKLHTNGVGLIHKLPKQYDKKKIVFVGHMCTLQNQDAVITFVNDIFPLILQKEPDTMFYIVGADPTRNVQQLNGKNVVVTGYVEDLEATISDACLAVAPVRVAAGIQNKVLVAMGCGLPVVLTSLIARAIPELKHEENCMIQDDNATIADACIRLIQHPELRTKLATSGYEMVQNHYSWREKIAGYIKQSQA